MLEWPPVKAWTSLCPIEKSSYFVAINYGFLDDLYWVNMVSVLDGKVSFFIDFEALRDDGDWLPGWIDFDVEIEKDSQELKSAVLVNGFLGKSCLHFSDDSGFSKSSNSEILRPWFPT